MHKTEKVRDILTTLLQRNQLESKIVEQKVFHLWRERLGVPFRTKTVPVSLTDGVLKIYTEYPPYRTELLLHKQKIIADLNGALEYPILTDLRIDLRPVRAALPTAERAPSKPSTPVSHPPDSESPDRPKSATPEESARIEQILANVTEGPLKTSLRRLFTTHIEQKPKISRDLECTSHEPTAECAF